jgi:hypothetical protein
LVFVFHFSSSYVQWTSPLRRSLDLEAHWQLKKWLLKVQSREFVAKRAAASAEGMNAPDANDDESSHHNSVGSTAASNWYYDPYEAMDKAALSALLQDRAKVGRHAGAVQRETTNYWLLEALRRGLSSTAQEESLDRTPIKQEQSVATGSTTVAAAAATAAAAPRYEAVVLGPAPPSYTSDHAVLLAEVGCELVLRGDNKPGLEPGSTITLELAECSPRLGTCMLTRVV